MKYNVGMIVEVNYYLLNLLYSSMILGMIIEVNYYSLNLLYLST